MLPELNLKDKKEFREVQSTGKKKKKKKGMTKSKRDECALCMGVYGGSIGKDR